MVSLQSQKRFVAASVVVSYAAMAFAQTNISINAQANRHPISPLIYGVAFGTSNQLSDLQATMNRFGGNTTSRYNWNLNAYNHAADWFFESIGEASSTPAAATDSFISSSLVGGAQPMVTVPMVPYIANVGPNRGKLGSFSVSKYGPQTQVDQWDTDAGNGISTAAGNPFITGNNPLDANVANSPTIQTNWIKHTIGKWGSSTTGGVKYYIMDNEPGLWNSTHRDVHPNGETYKEIIADYESYALAVRAQDPKAVIIGPEEWGWTNYIWSGSDSAWMAAHNWSGTPPDMAANGGLWHIPYILKTLAAYQKSTGKQLLNVLSLHYYPQSGEFSNDDSSNMQAIRNKSTRSLWDPNYTDVSWVNSVVSLIPRMKGWVNTYYPGLQTAITEYNWGDDAALNGATTQADVLGICGREGLDIATRWTCPATGTPTYLAMKMFRNYDGSKSAFGDTSVGCAVPNPDQLSAFASQRTKDGALTVLVINKVTSSAPVKLSLGAFLPGGSASVFQINSAAQTSISKLSNVSLTNGSISTTVPAQSITMFVIPKSAATVRYDFESNTQGWAGTSSLVTSVKTSTAESFTGKQSLAVGISGKGTETVQVSAPTVAAGKTVSYHVWIPTGSKISSVTAFVKQPTTGNSLVTSTMVPIGSLVPGSWNTISVAVPATAKTPLASLGVQFTTSASWTGTCYVDAIAW